jgi:RNA polymerase sigma-70 factor (ECF subfamily)
VQSAEEKELARLMRASIAGDERAYGEFLKSVGSLVRGFARRKVADVGIDAEDIVQETLLAIHVKRHTWRDEEPILPWLYAIARYKLLDAFRARGRRTRVETEAAAEGFAAPENKSISERDIERALETLSPGQRSAVAAVSVEGRSIRETAASQGMSEGAVRAALHRGLTAIAARFGRH